MYVSLFVCATKCIYKQNIIVNGIALYNYVHLELKSRFRE